LLRLRLGSGKKKNDDKESDRGTNSHSFFRSAKIVNVGRGRAIAGLDSRIGLRVVNHIFIAHNPIRVASATTQKGASKCLFTH
jgi:hypothetical protein